MKREGLLLLALMVCFLYSGVTAQETDLKVYCHGFTGEGPCILLYDPHCGSDNKTYTNKCFFCNAYVKSGKTLRLKHLGECR